MKIEGTRVWGFENATIGMRLPMSLNYEEAKSKCDSAIYEDGTPLTIGESDLKVMKNLINADDLDGYTGAPNSKYLRMIHVQVAVTAPAYFMAELDTYKVGTVRNSSSMQHRGTAKKYTIDCFEVAEKIKEILSIKSKDIQELTYPYETDEYKIYICENGREYKVFRNGRLFSCAYDLTDSSGRCRHFEEREVIPSITKKGYYEVNIGGRNGEKWFIHRLVAECWLDNINQFRTVDHINMNKGDNSVENLEWVSLEENIRREWENFDGYDLQKCYKNWKQASKINPIERNEIKKLYSEGVNQKEIATRYNISQSQVSAIILGKNDTSENKELFENCWYWEQIIDNLNMLRDKYLDTKDYKYFRLIRQLMPMSYLYTSVLDLNYETLRNIYAWRKNHKLTEWHTFCDWIRTLPYAEELILNDKGGKENA